MTCKYSRSVCCIENVSMDKKFHQSYIHVVTFLSHEHSHITHSIWVHNSIHLYLIVSRYCSLSFLMSICLVWISSICWPIILMRWFLSWIFLLTESDGSRSFRLFSKVCMIRPRVQVPYFLEISPHLEIPPPSKCHRIFQPTHPNKRCSWNLAAWYGVDNNICMRTRIVRAYK